MPPAEGAVGEHGERRRRPLEEAGPGKSTAMGRSRRRQPAWRRGGAGLSREVRERDGAGCPCTYV